MTSTGIAMTLFSLLYFNPQSIQMECTYMIVSISRATGYVAVLNGICSEISSQHKPVRRTSVVGTDQMLLSNIDCTYPRKSEGLK